MRKYIFLLGVMMMLLLSGCGPEPEDTSDTGTNVVDDTEVDEETMTCPSDCDDGDSCTEDFCSELTGYECSNDPIKPCCGDDVCDVGETFEDCPDDCESQMDEEIQMLLEKIDDKVSSLIYNYEGELNKEVVKYYLRGDKVKETFTKGFRYEEEWYDTVYLDLSTGKGIFYCEDGSDKCELEGQTADIPEDMISDYIPYSPFDLVDEIKPTAKVIEENSLSDGKPCVKIEYLDDESRNVHVCIWNFYGLPIEKEVKISEDTYETTEFTSVVVNDVLDKDVEMP